MSAVPPPLADNPSALKFEDEQSLVPASDFDGGTVCVRRERANARTGLHAPARRRRLAADGQARDSRADADSSARAAARHADADRDPAGQDGDAHRLAFVQRLRSVAGEARRGFSVSADDADDRRADGFAVSYTLSPAAARATDLDK